MASRSQHRRFLTDCHDLFSCHLDNSSNRIYIHAITQHSCYNFLTNFLVSLFETFFKHLFVFLTPAILKYSLRLVFQNLAIHNIFNSLPYHSINPN